MPSLVAERLDDAANTLEQAVNACSDHDDNLDGDYDDAWFGEEFYDSARLLIQQLRDMALNFRREIDGTEAYEQVAQNPSHALDEPAPDAGAPGPGGARERAALAAIEAIRASTAREAMRVHASEFRPASNANSRLEQWRELMNSTESQQQWRIASDAHGNPVAMQVGMELADSSIEHDAELELQAELEQAQNPHLGLNDTPNEELI